MSRPGIPQSIERREEGVLSDVVGLLDLTEQAIGDVECEALVPLDKLVECAHVAASSGLNTDCLVGARVAGCAQNRLRDRLNSTSPTRVIRLN